MSEQSVVIQKETVDLIYKIAEIEKPQTLDDEAIKYALHTIEKKLNNRYQLLR